MMTETEERMCEEYENNFTRLCYDRMMMTEAEERRDLEIYIYEGHKDAYGVKGRHYKFASMSMNDLRKEADRISAAIDVAIAEEKEREAEDLAAFKKEVDNFIGYGAGDRETALRWMTNGETFYTTQCVEGWLYNRGILFTDYGRNLVKELTKIVTFAENSP